MHIFVLATMTDLFCVRPLADHELDRMWSVNRLYFRPDSVRLNS